MKSKKQAGVDDLLKFGKNGDRMEILVETPAQREAFREFAQLAIRGLDSDIQKKTIQYVDQCKGSSLRAFTRYFYEGWLRYQKNIGCSNHRAEGAPGVDPDSTKRSYQSEGLTPEILKKIIPMRSFSGIQGVDFGFGNGEVPKTLSQMGARMLGFDLSPFFVQNARAEGFQASVATIDQRPDQFVQEFNLAPGSQDFAIATLVLDRLTKPLDFIQNFFQSLKSGGLFAIQTLLPIIPKDDGPVSDPIVYTPPENQITSGKDREEDKTQFLEVLKRFQGEKLEVEGIPYQVMSLDGVQNYTLWSFRGRKAA